MEVDGLCKKQKYAECGWKHSLKLTSPPKNQWLEDETVLLSRFSGAMLVLGRVIFRHDIRFKPTYYLLEMLLRISSAVWGEEM